MVENVYDLARDGKYDVRVNLIPHKKGSIKSGVEVASSRSTAHNIKWRSKN